MYLVGWVVVVVVVVEVEVLCVRGFRYVCGFGFVIFCFFFLGVGVECGRRELF